MTNVQISIRGDENGKARVHRIRRTFAGDPGINYLVLSRFLGIARSALNYERPGEDAYQGTGWFLVNERVDLVGLRTFINELQIGVDVFCRDHDDCPLHDLRENQ